MDGHASDLDNLDLAMAHFACHFRPLTHDSVVPHRHDYAEWHWVMDGHCAFLIDGQRHAIRRGDCFVIHPGQVHGVLMDKPGQWLLQYIVACDPDPALSAAWQQRAGPGGILSIGHGHHALFAQLQHAASHSDPWPRRAAAHRFQALICDILAARSPQHPRHPAVAQALDHMRAALRSRLSLDELAVSVGLNAQYLARRFRAEIGVAPMAYFNSLKMELAAALLRDQRSSVSSVASAVGFTDPFHFSRAFRQWSGHSPRQWRNIMSL